MFTVLHKQYSATQHSPLTVQLALEWHALDEKAGICWNGVGFMQAVGDAKVGTCGMEAAGDGVVQVRDYSRLPVNPL